MNIKETIGDIIRNAMDERITRLNEEKEEIENDLMDLRKEMREERRAEEPDLDEIERLSYEIDTCRDELLEINGILNPLSEVFEGLENESISAYKAIIEALFYDDSDDLLDLLWEALEELVNISKSGWKKIKIACLNLRNEDVLEARISEVLKEEGGERNE
ncbi:MAG: hypothetical protein SOZ71_07390 [Clostridium sp.]|nr:hypothetical protein [Clostridium sp.]